MIKRNKIVMIMAFAFLLLLSSCGINSRGYYEGPPARRGKVVIVNDRRHHHQRHDQRYNHRRYRLSSSEFSRFYYQLKMAPSDSQRRRIIREMPNNIELSRRQCADVLNLGRYEKQAYKMYKELLPHFVNRRDAEILADSFRSRKYREKAFRLAQRVPDRDIRYGRTPSRSRW